MTKKFNLKKNLIWIVPSIITIIAISIFASLNPSPPVCGDGLCQKREIENGTSFCDLDCAEQCTAATGSVEGNIEEQCSVGFNGLYVNLLKEGKIKKEYLIETREIDFSNPVIQQLAKELKRGTPKETARAIARWTFQNIIYDETDKFKDCKGIKASEVIERGSGVCSTMSKVNIALLRANGIPAHSITGCFNFLTSCRIKQTFFRRAFPQFINITIDETGYAPTMGFLHNWVVITLFEDNKFEEVIIESTAGLLYEDTCINYKIDFVGPPDSLACGLFNFDPIQAIKIQECIDFIK